MGERKTLRGLGLGLVVLLLLGCDNEGSNTTADATDANIVEDTALDTGDGDTLTDTLVTDTEDTAEDTGDTADTGPTCTAVTCPTGTTEQTGGAECTEDVVDGDGVTTAVCVGEDTCAITCTLDTACACDVTVSESGVTCEPCACADTSECGDGEVCDVDVCTCDADHADCDANGTNGCEIDTRVDDLHCGGCGMACAAGTLCASGQCLEPNRSGLELGNDHSCTLRSGEVWCWGSRQYGQLGVGSTSQEPIAVPTRVTLSSPALRLATGTDHTCVVLDTGAVMCWGYNGSGELGNDTNDDSDIPVMVSGITNAVDITAGQGFTCALLDDDSLQCWGNNNTGQFGNDSTSSSLTPVDGPDLTGITAISAGDAHACALLDAGAVTCWGRNDDLQLGNGLTDARSLVPVNVVGISNAVAIDLGLYTSCAVLSTGTVQCWGYNSTGQLGDENINDSHTPVDVPNVSGAIAVDMGGNHGCALLDTGEIMCWGDNSTGQVGVGDTEIQPPTVVPGLTDAAAVAASFNGDEGDHSCALRRTGEVLCWGTRRYAQLGDGLLLWADTPLQVSTAPTPTSLELGSGHTCATLVDGTASCWGYNSDGAVGNGTFDELVPYPAMVDSRLESPSPAFTSSSQSWRERWHGVTRTQPIVSAKASSQAMMRSDSCSGTSSMKRQGVVILWVTSQRSARALGSLRMSRLGTRIPRRSMALDTATQ